MPFGFRGLPIIVYSVFEGLGLCLFTLIHSAMLSSSACASATSFSLSFDATLTLKYFVGLHKRNSSSLFLFLRLFAVNVLMAMKAFPQYFCKFGSASAPVAVKDCEERPVVRVDSYPPLLLATILAKSPWDTFKKL